MGLTLLRAFNLLGLLLLQGITESLFGLLISKYKHRRDQVIQIGMLDVLFRSSALLYGHARVCR